LVRQQSAPQDVPEAVQENGFRTADLALHPLVTVTGPEKVIHLAPIEARPDEVMSKLGIRQARDPVYCHFQLGIGR
jgi:hypothetical protein